MLVKAQFYILENGMIIIIIATLIPTRLGVAERVVEEAVRLLFWTGTAQTWSCIGITA